MICLEKKRHLKFGSERVNNRTICWKCHSLHRSVSEVYKGKYVLISLRKQMLVGFIRSAFIMLKMPYPARWIWSLQFIWNQFTISSPDSLSKKRKYSRTNSPSLGCCALCQSNWADYFTVILLIDQRVDFWKLRVFFFFLFPFDFRKTGESKHNPKKWTYMGCNWYELTGVYVDGRQQEKELVMVMFKVDTFEGKKWWHKQKKVCIDCKVVSSFSQEVFVWKVMVK